MWFSTPFWVIYWDVDWLDFFYTKHLLYLFSWPVRWHQRRSCSSLWWCRAGSWSDWRRSQPGSQPRPPPIKQRPDTHWPSAEITDTDAVKRCSASPERWLHFMCANGPGLKVSGRLMCLWYQWSMSLAAKNSGKVESLKSPDPRREITRKCVLVQHV